MYNTLREYMLLPSISWPLQNILPNQPKLAKRIFHNHLAKRQLPEVGLLNPLLQLTAGIRFIRNVPPRLRNRQRFGSTISKPSGMFLLGGFLLHFPDCLSIPPEIEHLDRAN